MDYTSTMSEAAVPPPQDGQMPDGRTINRQPNGDIVIDDASAQEGARIPQPGDFDENLATIFTEHERNNLADQLLEYAEVDKTSRKDWEEREQRGMEMMGIKDIPKDRKKSPGMHDITHPMLATATVQFNARAIMEYFPPAGPVKAATFGKKTKDVLDQALRVETYMNFYLTDVDKGYFADSDQLLFYLPMGGSAFRKCSPDWRTGLPQLRYVKGTNFIAPYMGTDLETMPRYAHEYTMTGQDINRGMAIGTLLDTELAPPTQSARHSKTSDTADLREPNMHEDDHLYNMFEYHIEMALNSEELPEEERGVVLPWIILVEKETREILLVRRNWREADQLRMKRIWFAHYRFLPGLGFYGFGFPHIIGSLGLAASACVNALLDAAYMSNFPGGFKTKQGSGVPGGEIAMQPGVFKEVDADYEDLTKAFFRPDTGRPEPALFQLLQILVESGQQFSQTTEVATGEASNQAPVGTTVALIEESSRVQSAIHKRMHASAKDEFGMLADYIYEYMPNDYVYMKNGEEKHLLKTDFDGRVDVWPVSDPAIFSSTQRIALAQGVVELQGQAPDLYSRTQRMAGHRRMMEAMRVPDVDEVAPKEDAAPKFTDPIAENALLMVSQGVRAFPHQDHQAHILLHKNLLEHVLNSGLPPEEIDPVRAAIGAHLREHMALDYRNQVAQRMGIELPPFDLNGDNQELPPDVERGISMLAARDLPPPPPAPDAGDEAADGQAVIDKTDATIKAKQMESDAKLERDTKAFLAEELRKQQEFEAEEARKDQITQAQIVRDKAQGRVKVQQLARDGNLKHADKVRDIQSKEADRRLTMQGRRAEHAEKVRSTQETNKIKEKAASEAVKAKAKAAKAKPKPKAKSK